jgi:hypothetical protein
MSSPWILFAVHQFVYVKASKRCSHRCMYGAIVVEIWRRSNRSRKVSHTILGSRSLYSPHSPWYQIQACRNAALKLVYQEALSKVLSGYECTSRIHARYNFGRARLLHGVQSMYSIFTFRSDGFIKTRCRLVMGRVMRMKKRKIVPD